MNMEINYDTNRLIIIHYPAGAGGKFISLCLAVAENVLHQDYHLAKFKIQKKLNENKSFDISSKVLNKSSPRQHFELGCEQFAGFNLLGKEKQEVLANDLWRHCTNQKEYFFCMMNNLVFNGWKDYPNSKHIILKNYDWILRERNIEVPEYADRETFGNCIEFDMESCKDKFSFLMSIDAVCDFLDVGIKNKELLESLRLDFLKTYRLGFEK